MSGRVARAVPEWVEAKRVWDDRSAGVAARLAAFGVMVGVESECVGSVCDAG